MSKLHLGISVLIAITGIVLSSCESTTFEYEKRPYNDITRFTIIGPTGDSTRCLLQEDSIIIYWDPDVTLPPTITPSIELGDKAIVSPSSNTTVPLDEQTTFEVTAEDGSVKTYRLKIVKHIPTPLISNINGPFIWLNSSQITIYGDYFLSNTDPSEISAYLQRVSDGFEIPLEIIKSRLTNYTIIADLPPFSSEQDVGEHQLFVKTGNRTAIGSSVQFYAPPISHVAIQSSCEQAGQSIHAGDLLTIHYNTSSTEYGGKIAEFYSTQQIASILLYISYEAQIEVTDFSVTENTISFRLPESIAKYAGQALGHCRLYYKTVAPDWVTSSSYRHNIYFDSPSPISVATK